MATQHGNIFSRFFFGILRFIRNYFIFIGVMVTIGWVATIVLLTQGSKLDLEAPGISLSSSHPAVLWLDLAGKISEDEPSLSNMVLSHLLGGEPEVYLPELRTALRRAAKDSRISLLIVNLMPIQGSPADFAELRHLLADFREKSSKPVRVFLADISDWNYYIASAGSNITLNPAGEIALPGPTFQLIYFGEALKKLGVSIDVVRAGKYKSAFEPFVQNQPSEPTLEEYNSMQQSLLNHMVNVVAKGRGKDEAVVREWYKKSLYTTEEALQAGIIDNIGYPPQEQGDDDDPVEDSKTVAKVEAGKVDPGRAEAGKVDVGKVDDKKDHANDHGHTADNAPVDNIKLDDYLSASKHDRPAQESVTDQGGIGLIEATGEITLGPRGRTAPGGSDDGINPSAMHKKVRWALENHDVKAVVLRISSPGGSATASDMIWNDLKTLAAAKPLVISMGAYAASGGYYIAVPGRRLIAEPTTITGSIGVIGMLPSAQAFEEKWGVSFYMVSSSDRKQMLNLGAKASAEDKALLENTIGDVYKTFMHKVAEGRKMSLDKVASLAQGRVYTGLQAKELGLIDEIGGVDAAFRAAKDFAGFDVSKLYPVLHYEEQSFSISDCLKRPSRIAQCLKHISSQTVLPSLFTADEQGISQVAARVAAWATAPQQERSLMLWSGYLSLVWP